jgi:hypothetical protein
MVLSRKSLSPVTMISAPAFIAALRIGLSSTSRILSSVGCSDCGTGIISTIADASSMNFPAHQVFRGISDYRLDVFPLGFAHRLDIGMIPQQPY